MSDEPRRRLADRVSTSPTFIGAGTTLTGNLDCSGDLVVAGGYSHSRMRESILGGATRTLLEGCPVPVLLSH